MHRRKGCLLSLWRPLVWLALLVMLTSASVLPEKAFDLRLLPVIEQRRFDWIAWETEALASEAGSRLGLLRQINNAELADSTGEVLAFVDRQCEIDRLDGDLQRAYAQVGHSRLAAPLADRADETMESIQTLENRLEQLESQQSQSALKVEQILSTQVTEVLGEEGMAWGGRIFPPVTFRFTALPSYLIISPRDHIYMYRGIFLDPDIKPGEREEIERSVEQDPDVSALVDDVGGIGSWPTMVIDSASLRDLIDIVAHEWTHTYLFFSPLGQHYDRSRDLTTMNETVASLVGEEIAQKTLETYYPELTVLPDSKQTWRYPTKAPDVGTPETFSQAMRRIRLKVDALLAAGEVEEAEKYMEVERQKLVEKGADLRRLNQAYFAFHGSYATSPSSVDPIGPWMRQLRAKSGSLEAFLRTVSKMTSLDDLHTALAS